MNATETISAVDARPGRAPAETPPRRVIPLSMRKADIAILGFYWINLLFITYIVDVEQLVIPDMHGAWSYPIWPPKPMVDLIHWYGNNFDPVLIARPVWWKMTIWIDSLLFGPYYAFAIYAFTKGKNWIRLPSIIQSSFLITVVLVILGEETWGEHATPNRLFVYLDNAPWLLFPIFVIFRMYRSETPLYRRERGRGTEPGHLTNPNGRLKGNPMSQAASPFAAKYGPWAIVAGASEGLGAAFAEELAGRGLSLVLIARRAVALEGLAQSLRTKHGVEVHTAAIDLGDPSVLEQVKGAIGDREIGLLVYNAAYSEIGRFLDLDIQGKLKTLDVNCRAPLLLTDLLGKAMAARGRGGILLMSSLAGFQGSAMVTVYAATKAFNTVLGEGLWDELRRHGVDVVPFIAGATTTPNFLKTDPKSDTSPFAPPLMSPEAVAREALESLGKGPHAVAGRGNRLALFVMDRLMGRRSRIEIMGRATRKMYPQKNAGKS